MMGSKDNQTRMNEDDGVDRLSSLSDDLIHKIFSSISTKFVVQTSAFSSRWRFIWTSIPNLNISTQDFSTLPKLSKFVRHVLSRRNTEIEVSSVKLSFGNTVSKGFVKEIMDYVFCHNIHQLNLSCLIPDGGSEFPLSFISFPSLKYLRLSNGMDMSSFELPAALTTLYLHCVVWSNNELFSKCENLKNLTLESCGNVNSENFSMISHPRLSNLTLDDNFSLNIVTPKLENLTIRNGWNSKEYVIKIYAPDLTSFVYWGEDCSLSLSTDGFDSLKEADIHVSEPSSKHSRHVLSLLRHIHNVKFLTLNMEILEHFSSCVEQILHQTFAFTNLERLKMRQQSGSLQGQAPNKSYYLDCRPGATLEEIVAQSIVLEFSMILEQEKADSKTSSLQTAAGTKLQVEKSVTAKIERCLEHILVQIDQKKSTYRLIISKLQKTEEVLAKLPASTTALIQPCLASLRAEAVLVMGGITDLIKTQCDENESQISVCIRELATAWINPSSN